MHALPGLTAFRKLPLTERTKALESLGLIDDDLRDLGACSGAALVLADVLIESAAGCMPLPLGIAAGFRIDDVLLHIPMVSEEASVLLAASYAGGIAARHGGFQTEYSKQALMGQIAFSGLSRERQQAVKEAEKEMLVVIKEQLLSMKQRGGGYCSHCYRQIGDFFLVDLYIDVCDAMGANIMNTVLEHVRTVLEDACKQKALCAIVSNFQPQIVARARCALPFTALFRNAMPGAQIAERILAISELAKQDVYRAVTHNKGIMNGVTALALATGNDTRAMEAAVHSFAARDGQYRGLGTYHLSGSHLHAELSLPLHFATVGGACDVHPVARFSHRLLGAFLPVNSESLSRIAAALGLAQNFAALFALASEGIQTGHMKHHNKRIAWKLGARGENLHNLCEAIQQKQVFGHDAVAKLYNSLKK